MKQGQDSFEKTTGEALASTGDRGALFHRDPTYDHLVLVRGEGVHVFDQNGKRYIDGISGAGNLTPGHGRRSIVEAMAEQAAALADSRRGSYHGATLGALALTGLPAMRAPFTPWLPEFPHVVPCYPHRGEFPGCEGKCNLKRADDFEQVIVQTFPRKTDFVTRYASEEFSIILQQDNIDVASQLGERLIKRVAETCFHHDGHDMTVTLSTGATAFVEGQSAGE